MLTSAITQKGQITIPASIRKELGLKQGDHVQFVYKKGKIEVTPYVEYSLDDLFGCLPKPKVKLTDEEIDQAIGDAVIEDYIKSIKND